MPPANQIFNRLLKNGPLHVFHTTVDLIRRLRAGHVPVRLVSSSRKTGAVLERAGLTGLFDLVIDGQSIADLGLPGKPDPALFLEAARRMGRGAGPGGRHRRRMVSLNGTDIVSVPLEMALGQLKTVPEHRYQEAAVLFG